MKRFLSAWVAVDLRATEHNHPRSEIAGYHQMALIPRSQVALGNVSCSREIPFRADLRRRRALESATKLPLQLLSQVQLGNEGGRLTQQFRGAALGLTAFLALATISPLVAATLTQQIDPPEVNVGDQATLTLTIQNGTMGDFHLPPVDGLQPLPGITSTTNVTFSNGTISSSESESVHLIATRAGDFTIPAFDVPLRNGGSLRTQPMKLHVLDNGSSPSTKSASNPSAPVPAPAANPAVTAPFNPNGPVVMPPANSAAAPAPPANGNSTDSIVPRDKDGGPAKVFIVITPQTTDAYVGQAITLQIDFYIRMDVNAEQNSLPTIKGIDFLMNSFTHRGSQTVGILEGQQYLQETWRTSIAAPKSGDFPLSMERDTYWIKSITNNGYDPFSGFANRQANLAHEPITSNQLIIHIHDLPTEGRPAHFTGAIGQFNVTGEAQPTSVEIGEPVTLRFTIRGEGNFDYVRCPTLTDATEWKTYVPRSEANYLDEAHTQAVKIFEQSVIPLKNGNIPLPAASFSYFDPTAKQYVTVPLALPNIMVTGTPPPLASATPDGGAGSVAIPGTTSPAELLPNRLEIGSLRTSLAPVYRQRWFWAVQGVLLSLPLLGAIFLVLRSRSAPDDGLAEHTRRQRALRIEEDAMAEAVRRDDAPAFFIAARHAIQLRLGVQWTVRPEALTLGEIRGRDPQLAGTLEPLFKQADEVIYSGHATPGLDLAQWEQCVRTELLSSQPT